MKRSSIQLNTKDDKQDKNLTKRSKSNVFHITSILKNCHWVQHMLKLLPKLGLNHSCMLLFLYTVTSNCKVYLKNKKQPLLWILK